MNLGLNEIFAVIDKVKSAELEGFEYSDVDMKIKIKNCGGKAMGRSFSSGMQMTGAEMDTLKTNMQGSSMAKEYTEGEHSGSSYMAGAEELYSGASYAERAYQEAKFAENGNAETVHMDTERTAAETIVVESPMVGTFYAAPSEGAEPFVSVGKNVKKGQIIGIIEAMKLMNEIEATADGIVEEILVENETLVEFGQPLLKIRKEG